MCLGGFGCLEVPLEFAAGCPLSSETQPPHHAPRPMRPDSSKCPDLGRAPCLAPAHLGPSPYLAQGPRLLWGDRSGITHEGGSGQAACCSPRSLSVPQGVAGPLSPSLNAPVPSLGAAWGLEVAALPDSTGLGWGSSLGTKG